MFKWRTIHNDVFLSGTEAIDLENGHSIHNLNSVHNLFQGLAFTTCTTFAVLFELFGWELLVAHKQWVQWFPTCTKMLQGKFISDEILLALPFYMLYLKQNLIQCSHALVHYDLKGFSIDTIWKFWYCHCHQVAVSDLSRRSRDFRNFRNY